MNLFDEEMHSGLHSLIEMDANEVESCMLTFTLDVQSKYNFIMYIVLPKFLLFALLNFFIKHY